MANKDIVQELEDIRNLFNYSKLGEIIDAAINEIEELRKQIRALQDDDWK